MSKVTRRTVCAGLAAAPAAMALATVPGSSAGPVISRTQAAAASDIIARVIETVADHEGVSADTMLSPLRTREAVDARRKALYLAYRLSGKSLPEIGRRFGGRDHTTVLHAVRTIETRANDEAGLHAELLHLARCVEPHGAEKIAQSEARMPRYRPAQVTTTNYRLRREAQPA